MQSSTQASKSPGDAVDGLFTMRTDALITMLARGAGAAPRAAVARRLAPACAAGLCASALFAFLLVGPMPAMMLQWPGVWWKLGYTASLALTAAWLVARASSPAARLPLPAFAVLLVVLTMGAAAATSLTWVAPGTEMSVVMGQNWLVCSWNVFSLSAPALALLFWAMRGLAPTSPRLAGFATGLLAGALGAVGYAFVCPEGAPAFVALWYSLGILLTAVLGANLGERFLHW